MDSNLTTLSVYDSLLNELAESLDPEEFEEREPASRSKSTIDSELQVSTGLGVCCLHYGHMQLS